MALQDCIKKAGKNLTKKDADKIRAFVKSGMTEQQAVDQYLASIDQQLVDLAKLAESNGLDVKRNNVVWLDSVSDKKASESKSVKSEAQKPEEKIEDFGEKIGGARKDIMAYANKLAGDMDVEKAPLSKSFPKPDYVKLAADGVDKRTLVFIAQLRGEIPARAKKYGKAARAQKIRTAREVSNSLLTGAIDIDAVVERMQADGKSSYLKHIVDIMNIAETIPAENIESLGNYKITKERFGFFEGKKNVDKWEVTDTSKKEGWGGLANRTHFDSKEDAVKHIISQVKSPAEATKETGGPRKTSLDVFQTRKTGELWIGKKLGSGKYIELKRFEKGVGIAEVRKYQEENYDKLVELLNKKKSIPFMRKEKNDPRVGKDYREGKNVTPEMFSDAFGFRGIEFGNWVEQGKRQEDLNNAYDGLMDLADILDVPPKAMSLNGELGLAFGARGKGGKHPAAAHYEANKVVINLTKKSGAGSLAHEWFHALDNYFSRTRGRPHDMLTEEAYQRTNKDGTKDTSVRPEVIEAYKSVVSAIKKSGVMDRSLILDGRRAKDYWSTVAEMSARSFEKYVIDKASDKNEKSDYLANIQSEQYWNVMDAMEQGLVGTDAKEQSTYPYPTDEEAKAINDAFDNLFNILETKETDKGTALFSVPNHPGFSSDDTEVTAALKLIAENDEVYTYPRSKAQTLEEIAQEVDPELDVFDNTDAIPDSETFTKETGIHVPTKDKSGKVTAYNPVVVREKGNEVWINASALTSGESRGSEIYHIVANYAYNTGKVFVADPDGMSAAATRRRTEHMLSSALKFGTTHHMQPGKEQIDPAAKGYNDLRPLKWGKNDAKNLQELVDTSIKNTLDAVPEVADLVYNFDTDQFEDTENNDKSFTEADFERTATVTGRRGTAAIGPNTIKRAVYLNSLVRGTGQGRGRRILAQNAKLGSAGKRLAAALKGIFYSVRNQTNSPAFKKWFGGSKVVDENGNPLVVYHSTSWFFDVFDTEINGGSHFGTAAAADEANKMSKGISYEIEKDDDGYFVTPDNGQFEGEVIGEFDTLKEAKEFVSKQPKRTPLMAVFLSIKNPKRVEDAGVKGGWEYEREKAIAEGYDGLVYTNEVEDAGTDSYVAFYPEQIKSAIGNNGNFDPSDPRITYSTNFNGNKSHSKYSVADVERLIAPLKAKVGADIDVKVIKDVAALNKAAPHIDVPIGENPDGVFDEQNGTVYILADNTPDPIVTYAHEVTGHVGMEGIVENWNDIVDEVAELRKSGDELTNSIWKEVNDRYGFLRNDKDRVKEFFAIAQERRVKEGKIGSLLRQIRAALRKFLKSLGIKKFFKNSEIDLLLNDAARYVRTGEGTATGFGEAVVSMMSVPAWHGSPHDHDGFRMANVGTGEGAAAYGWGLYFAGRKEVAEFYKGKLSSVLRHKGRKMNREAGYNSIDSAAWAVHLSHGDKEQAKMSGLASPEKIDAIETESLTTGGRLYQVELAPNEEDYLLWDKPLSEQSAKVREALKEAWDTLPEGITNRTFEKAHNELLRGGSLYMSFQNVTDSSKYISDALNGTNDSGKAASEYLRKFGIRGIKYLDGSSRNQGEGDYNYVIFDEADVEIKAKFSMPSSGAAKLRDARIKRSRAKVKRFFQRNFTKEGLLNTAAFETKLESDAYKNVGEEEIAHLVHDFERGITAATGKKYNELSQNDLNRINDYISGKPDSGLPEEIRNAADNLRAYLDSMSGKMLDSIQDIINLKVADLSPEQLADYELALSTNGAEGKIPADIMSSLSLMNTISSNIGVYLNRSYRAFDDENWKETALADEELIAEAEGFIRENNPSLTDDEVTGAVRAILQDAKDSGNFVGLIAKGTKVGSKDVSITKRRKDVPDVIRRLLGEHKDPKLNFARSASKMQWYVANHHFLFNLREKGLGLFLYKKPTGEYDAQIAGDASETMNPLNGMYTTEDFRQGMEDVLDKFDGSDLMRNLIRLNSFVKYGKTILSPTTQARNFLSAYFFRIMNGHFSLKHDIKAFKVARSDLFTHDAKWMAYINDLISLGVLHDNPYASELKAALNDAIQLDIYKKGGTQAARKLLDFMQRTYAIGDDFHKIVGFETELKRQLDAGLTQEEARKKAAYRIRNGYPTYSMVPRAIKKLRRWPLIGTFVSFPYEIVRTTYNQAGFIKEDMQNNKSAAVQRMIGMAVASSAAYAASVLSMALMGMDGDDDEAVRAQLPEWSRNSQLYYIGYDEDGLPVYLDLSFLDPYTYLKKPLTALVSGNNRGIDKKITDAMTEMAEPFIGSDIAAGAALELWSNKKQSGGRVYNPQDTGYRQFKDIVDHTRKALQPGVFSNAERIALALQGESASSGRQYKIKDEIIALAGFRTGTLNLSQSLVYKSYSFADAKRNASSILSKEAGSQSDITEDDLEGAFKSMIKAREKAYGDMIKLVEGAKKLGVPEFELRKAMKAARISNQDTAFLMRGDIPRWRMSPQFIKSATDRAIVSSASPQRKAEIRKEMIERRKIIRGLIKKHNH